MMKKKNLMIFFLLDKYSTEKDNLFDLLKEENYTEANIKKVELIETTDSMSEKLNKLIQINQN